MALIGLSAAFVVLAVAMVIGHSAIAGKYASYIGARCATGRIAANCDANVFANNENFFSAVVIALRVLPVVVGVFLGAPLLAREIESGTFRFSWTQAVGRSRQIAVQFALMAGFLVTSTLILGLFLGWFAHPFEVTGVDSQWGSGLFETTPLVIAGWTTFAFALGTFLGAFIRRTVVAMAVSGVVLGALALGSTFEFVHRLLDIAPVVSSHVAPLTNPGSLNVASYPGYGPPGTWLVRAWYTGPHGLTLTSNAAVSLEAPMNYTKYGKPDPEKWLSLHHYFYSLAYQPVSRFWVFQGAEVVVLLGLAAVCVVATILRVRRG
jgi:hypothetical protein